MEPKRFFLMTMAGLAMGVAVAAPASAEYPERPISMIVAASPGGGTDISARTLAPFLEKYLGGATITVINKPGAGTEIGLTTLAKSKPDGYTIGMLNVPHMIAIPIERKAAFDLDSFELLANLVNDACAFNVSTDSPFKTLDDLVAYAKKNPGAVTVGTSGIGGDDHLAMLMFEKAAGVKLTHVPFPSGAPARAATLGGHISVGAFNISEALEYAQEEQIRVLGIMSDKRWDMAPDVPTFKEQGYDVTMASQRGMGAPAGIPQDRLAKIKDAIDKSVNDPEYMAQVKKMNIPAQYMASQEYSAYLRKADERMRAMWQESPWKKKKK